ncbi:MAG: isoprenylcysteine carboxylmethyltransferase family protein [Bryobacteraceae bacterium]
MELSIKLYLGLLAGIAFGRLIELRHSRRNQRRLLQAGSSRSPEPCYVWLVIFHAAVPAAAALEVIFLHRPLIPWLAAVSLAAWIGANLLRWWAIRSLGPRWNVQVMSISSLGVAIRGPYRWIRHPNYAAVFVEMAALPLIHSAWLTAALTVLPHLLILRTRIALEESVLMRDPAYRAAFGAKPRFLPRLTRQREYAL